MKRLSIALAFLMLIAVTMQASAEEIRLSTIVPDQQVVRGKAAVIGTTYRDKTGEQVPDDDIIVEGNADINGTIKVGNASAPEGTVRYDVDSHAFKYYNGTAWVPLGGGGIYNTAETIVYDQAVTRYVWTTVKPSDYIPEINSRCILFIHVYSAVSVATYDFRQPDAQNPTDLPYQSITRVYVNTATCSNAMAMVITDDKGDFQFYAPSPGNLRLRIMAYIKLTDN